MSRTIFFSVGEPSGDQHAARLIRSLQERDSGLRFRGFGGPAMSAEGCQLETDLTKHAVVGLLEVLPKLRQFFRFADQAEDVFRKGDVDAVVLVDFPGFNWHVARRAKKYGIPVYYYCPPQLWAWGGWRRKKMRRTVDHVLCVLPIEEKFFADAGLSTTFVGHPFFDAVASQPLDTGTMGGLAEMTRQGRRLVGVLPGSRTHEVRRNWPLMLDTIRRLHRRQSEATFLVAAYRDEHCLWCRDQLRADDASLPLKFYVGATSEIIESAHCAMMVSGSVSLELMARRTPAAVVYRVGRFLHAFGKRVIQVDSLTLPNLMHQRKVFPEMVSVGNPGPAIDFLTESIDAMLGDEYYYRHLQEDLESLCQRFAMPGASGAAADTLANLMAGGKQDAAPDILSVQPSRVEEPESRRVAA